MEDKKDLQEFDLDDILGEFNDIPGAEDSTGADASAESTSAELTTEAAATLEITTEEHSSEQDVTENLTGEFVVG